MKPSRKRGTLIAIGLAELALALAAARTIDRDASFPVYLGLYLAMGVCWLAATFVVLSPTREREVEGVEGEEAEPRVRPAAGGSVLGAAVLFGLLFRAVFLPTAPVLSDDIYRYVWDGRVAHAGVNPYRYAPESDALAALRNEDYLGINNKDIPTIYPPVMQMAFFLVTAVSESPFAMKLFFVLVDVALWLVLVGLLRACRLDPGRALIYIWCPLPIVEIGASGHNDVLGALFLMAALLAFVRGGERSASFLLTLSGLAKLLGFAIVPLFARHLRWTSLAVVPAGAAALSLPYASAGELAFRGLREYGLRWRGNDGLFHLLYAITGSLDAAKILAAVLLVALTAYIFLRRADPLPAAYVTVGAVLLLSATVHPWYLLWIAPFLCIYPSPAWLYLTLAVALGYHAGYLALPGQAWEDTPWVKLVEYLPFFLLLLLTRLRGPWNRNAFSRF